MPLVPLVPLFPKISVLIALIFSTAALAQAVSTTADYQALALQWARGAAQTALPASIRGVSLDVSVGAIDPRLKLAPCANVEPYLPVGARLWGKNRIALRCIDGLVRWNVSLPVTVKANGRAWVIKNPIAPGVAITASDVIESDVDWAEEPAPVLLDAGVWEGQVATRALATGQTLRLGMLKAAQVFQAGAQVRVVAQGLGFEVSGDAFALSSGVVGQLARVRMENGRIASGIWSIRSRRMARSMRGMKAPNFRTNQRDLVYGAG